MKHFFSARAQQFLLKVFRISMAFSIASFAFARMIFYELPFSVEDIFLFAKIIVAGFAATLFGCVSFYLVIAVIRELSIFLLNPQYRRKNIVGRIVKMKHLPNDFFESGNGDRTIAA